MTIHRGSIQNGRGATGLADGATASKTSTPTLATGRSHFARHGTDRVHYLTIGHGRRTFVLLHGWACHLGFWREQVAALADDDARLVLVDLPGHGQSDPPQADCTLDFFAAAVIAVLQDAKVDKATFISHSMGKAVACHVLTQAPEMAVAVVSVDGLLRRPQSVPGQTEAMLAQFRSPHYREVAKAFVSTFFPIAGSEALRDALTAEMLLTPQNVMASALAAMLDENQPNWNLPPVAVPVLVLNAKTSHWLADDENYVRSLSPQTEYRQFENVGHFLMLEKPAEFNAALTELLRKYGLMAK